MADHETRPCMYGDGDVDAGDRVEVLTKNGPRWSHTDCHTFGKAMRG